MERSLLAGIASSRPVIYTEGFFVSCYLEHAKFIPEEGLNQFDLETVLNGEFLKAGSDLVEDFTLKCKLRNLTSKAENSFELEQFPQDFDENEITDCNLTKVIDDNLTKVLDSNLTKVSLTKKESHEPHVEDIPMVRIKAVEESDDLTERKSDKSNEVRRTLEKQVSWLLSEGEDFVAMETFIDYQDALILIDVLKEHNVPLVVSFLARRDEPIAITFSKIKVGLDCLMFCLFQA